VEFIEVEKVKKSQNKPDFNAIDDSAKQFDLLLLFSKE
jgi:hypothetical protein